MSPCLPVEESLRNTQSSFDGNSPAGYPALSMETVVQATSVIAKVILRRVVSEAKREREKTLCHLNDSATIFLSNSLGAHIRPGDEINFPLPPESAEAGTEIYVRKASSSGGGRDLYHAPIRYAAQPKADRRERLYVRAQVPTSQLGISSIHLPCEVVRDHFYVATTKEAIRQNRANVADRLGFLGRVVHGSNPRIWLRTLTARLGEAADYAQVASE